MKRPEIRFEGFTDDWEQRKLGELSQRVIVGLATSVTPYYRDEGIPILRNLNIKENYLDDSDILYLDEDYANSQTGKQIHTADLNTVCQVAHTLLLHIFLQSLFPYPPI